MKLILSGTKTLYDVQAAFSTKYPFLKLEFYKPANEASTQLKKCLPASTSLQAAGLKHTGEIEIKKEMTVDELETSFRLLFGLDVEVSRKSGPMWLETTLTNKWSLQKQNDYGCQISHSF